MGLGIRSIPTLGGGGGTTGVPSGGTGQATLTAHAVLVGEGTSPVAQIGPGALATVLTGQGAADPSFVPGFDVVFQYGTNGGV